MRVKPYENRVLRMNAFRGQGWSDLVKAADIHWGQRIVFTTLEFYRLSVVIIGGDGLGLNREDIRPALLKRIQRPVFYRDRNGNI